MGVMANLNVVISFIMQKPKVAILTTGNEILELGGCSNNPVE